MWISPDIIIAALRDKYPDKVLFWLQYETARDPEYLAVDSVQGVIDWFENNWEADWGRYLSAGWIRIHTADLPSYFLLGEYKVGFGTDASISDEFEKLLRLEKTNWGFVNVKPLLLSELRALLDNRP
jgi:hypothetical protein